ncbi:hypothetical protein ABVV53_05325 [Novosphingobium sp. RD2P27]|uniref:Uncharacterized protein n=1 Tax=Novosphingobium kalidii TaxID=3230299 RepID=A0ABV2CZ47_9SPHN
MRLLPILCAGAALIAAPAYAAAPKGASARPAAGQKEAPAEVQHAMLYLKVLISALQADKLDQGIKGALVGCLYNNTLGTITESMDKLIAANPDKVSRDDPNQLLQALAAVCGFQPEAPTPASSDKPTGR